LENIAVKTEDIVLFYTENKWYMLWTGKKQNTFMIKTYILASNDPAVFPHNRKYVVNINFIKSYKSYEKVKLMVDLSVPKSASNCYQPVAAEFKWMAGTQFSFRHIKIFQKMRSMNSHCNLFYFQVSDFLPFFLPATFRSQPFNSCSAFHDNQLTVAIN
jgi:hypothetical protein